jgi:hypothetical protein
LTRLLVVVALAEMGGALVWKLLMFLDRAHWAVLSPHEIDYGEGIVWQQVRMIMDGRGYRPLGSFPAIVFHYPPVYHVLAWLVASVSGASDLAAGRALSSLSTLVAAAFVGVIAGMATAGSSNAARWTCGATAALVSLTCAPVAYWGVLMRVDMVAVALALGGLCLAMFALRKPALIYLAAIAFVGAVFTKQTMLAAPGAAFLVLLVLRPGLAVRGVAACVGLGLVVLCGLLVATHGEFARHIFGYNINRFSLYRLRSVGDWAGLHVIYLLVGVIGLSLSGRQLLRETGRGSLTEIRHRLRADVGAVWLLIAIAYLVAATCFLILVAKSGSAINYYVEWFLAGSVFVGVGVRQAADVVFPPAGQEQPAAASFSPFVLTPVLVVAGVLMAPPVNRYDGVNTAADQAQLATLTRWISAAKRPVISDNMVIVREAGKEVVLEPAIIAELTANGVYDDRPLIRMIRNREFAFFVTARGCGDSLSDSRYSSAVAAAICQSYPRVEQMAGLSVHMPARAPGLGSPRL